MGRPDGAGPPPGAIAAAGPKQRSLFSFGVMGSAATDPDSDPDIGRDLDPDLDPGIGRDSNRQRCLQQHAQVGAPIGLGQVLP